MAGTTQRQFIASRPVESEDVSIDIIEADYKLGIAGSLSKASLQPGDDYPEDTTYVIQQSWKHFDFKSKQTIGHVRAIKYVPWS